MDFLTIRESYKYKNNEQALSVSQKNLLSEIRKL